MSDENLWVFGYGSLCWNPGFKYSDAQLGYIKGFKRRFWQGNNSHRGTEKKLGRVVTLIEDENEVTYGKAFQLDDEQASKTYLDTREVQLGGYTTILTDFIPLDENIEPFPVLIYIALENNDQYLGEASYDEMAMDIISSKGQAGHNLEYLAKLARFMREHLPLIEDDHLYLLEQLCIFILKSINSTLLNYFYSRSVEEKWLQKIQIELDFNAFNRIQSKQQRLKKSSSLELANAFELSDEEIADTSETMQRLRLTNYGCCDLVNTELFNSDNLILNNLLNGCDCLFRNGKLLINQNTNHRFDNAGEIAQNQDQNHQTTIRKSKKSNFSEFSDYQNYHPKKLYIKSY